MKNIHQKNDNVLLNYKQTILNSNSHNNSKYLNFNNNLNKKKVEQNLA